MSPTIVNIYALATPVTVTVSEKGYSGSFAFDATPCTGVATVAAGAKAGTFTITGVAAGKCSITFTDAFSQAIVLPVIVTTTVAGITIG